MNIVSRPSNQKFRDNYGLIFGKKDKPEEEPKADTEAEKPSQDETGQEDSSGC